MRNSQYEETIAWLFQQFPSYQKIGSSAYKPTLENIERILELIDNPQNSLKFVHVAGSNGKGSVCSIIASTLTEAGHKTGLFTSPHIKDFTERIRVNGKEIHHEDVIDFVERIKSFDLSFEPSFFEITFAMALDHFQKEACDICVIETGLGGRLDATNIIHPELSVITSISLEHTQILGDTIEKIAFEKAGIIKKNTPVVIGKLDPQADKTIKEVAARNHSEVIHALESPFPSVITDYLLADYQLENLFIAKKALEHLHSIQITNSDDDLEKGIQNLSLNTGFRGRLQVINKEPLIILDVSHNPAGILSTMEAINKINKGQLHIIFGASSDKDLNSIIKVFPKDAIYYITEFASDRTAKKEALKAIFDQTPLESVDYFDNPEIAFEMAKNIAAKNDTVLVIGSFFLLEHFF